MTQIGQDSSQKSNVQKSVTETPEMFPLPQTRWMMCCPGQYVYKSSPYRQFQRYEHLKSMRRLTQILDDLRCYVNFLIGTKNLSISKSNQQLNMEPLAVEFSIFFMKVNPDEDFSRHLGKSLCGNDHYPKRTWKMWNDHYPRLLSNMENLELSISKNLRNLKLKVFSPPRR